MKAGKKALKYDNEWGTTTNEISSASKPEKLDRNVPCITYGGGVVSGAPTRETFASGDDG